MNTILIVDSEETARRALCVALRSDEYEILEAASGPAALALLQARPVDLVITEYLRSGMNGLEFLRQALALRPETLRIMLTGHADLDIAVAAINEGAVYRFVLKPWDTFDLRFMMQYAIREVERKRAEVSAT